MSTQGMLSETDMRIRDLLAHIAELEAEVDPVIAEIAAEQRRQVEVEGWTPERDDEHDNAQLIGAAISYALPPNQRGSKEVFDHEEWTGNARYDDSRLIGVGTATVPSYWPWLGCWWKPKDRRRDLIRAAALIVAEIKRLDRAARSAAEPTK